MASSVGKPGAEPKSATVVKDTSGDRTITNQSATGFQSPLKYHLVPAESGHIGGDAVKQTVIIQDIGQEQNAGLNLALRAHNTSISKKDKMTRERGSDIFIVP